MATEITGMWTCARGAGRRLGRQGQRTRMGWQRWRTKSGHPTTLTAFLRLQSLQRSQSPGSVGGRQHSCSLPAVAREGDAIEDTRGVHSGWGARGAASPRTHRPHGHLLWGPGLTRTSGPPGTGSCEQKSKRRLSAELAEGGWRRQALRQRGHLGGFLAGQVQGRKIALQSWAAPTSLAPALPRNSDLLWGSQWCLQDPCDRV